MADTDISRWQLSLGTDVKLVLTIPLESLRISLGALSLQFVGFVLVQSQGQLKIYKQVR